MPGSKASATIVPSTTLLPRVLKQVFAIARFGPKPKTGSIKSSISWESVMDESMRTRVRSIFISDVHLGCRHSKADLLLSFLKSYTCDQLYLVGDIIDGWK